MILACLCLLAAPAPYPESAGGASRCRSTGRAGEEVPAHRILSSRGILSGAASFDTPDMQKLLLEGEGVKVEWTPEGYRVDLKRFGWRNTLEEAEALRARFEMEQI